MWQCSSYKLDTRRPLVMGILNITPDSFSDGGAYCDEQAAYAHARQMLADGADIIDVGGESTRPGSEELPVEEELARIEPVVWRLAREGTVVSVDTRHAAVAEACVRAGAAIINDISGFRDEAMVRVASASDVGLIVMHMQGNPKNMQLKPHYDDIISEISGFLSDKASILESNGVAQERIALDPGPGFGKEFNHNLAILRATGQFARLGYPLVAAWSRKRFVGELSGVAEPAQRVSASVAVAFYAACHGASILRVHDVAPTVQAVKVLEALQMGRLHG
jgi:dihydropteroate synthase